MKLIPNKKVETFPNALAEFNRQFHDFLVDWEKGLDHELPFFPLATHHQPVDLAEVENAYQLSIDLPGLEEKDIQVKRMGDHLIVSGERTVDKEVQGGQFLRQECRYGAFRRTIPLPLGLQPDLKEISATYKRGVLTIRIPKAAPTPTMEIPIRTE